MTWEEKNLGIIKCLRCDKQFTKKTKTHLFCSKKCRVYYNNVTMLNLARELDSIICPHCKMEFSIKQIKGDKK